jgi:hypothetical protein
LDADTRTSIAERFVKELGIPRVAVLAALETLLPHSEKVLTPELQRLLCLQFAANWESIKKGVPVNKFTGVGQAMWLPVEILGFENEQRGKHIFAKMHVDIIDGLYAGYQAIRVVPYGFLHILGRDLGYMRRRPYEEPKDLKGFRFAAWVNPSAKDDIQFDKYWLTSAMEKSNNALVKQRKPTERELEEQDIQE